MVNKRNRRKKRANTLSLLPASQHSPVAYTIDLDRLDLGLLPLENLLGKFRSKVDSDGALVWQLSTRDSLDCLSFTVHAARESSDECVDHPASSDAPEADAQVAHTNANQKQPNVLFTNHLVQPTHVHKTDVSFCHICCAPVPPDRMDEHNHSFTHVSQLQLAHSALFRLNQHYERPSAVATHDTKGVNEVPDAHYCVSCNIEVQTARIEVHERETKHREAARTVVRLTELYELYVTSDELQDEADSFALAQYVADKVRTNAALVDERKETLLDESSRLVNNMEGDKELQVVSTQNNKNVTNGAVRNGPITSYSENIANGLTGNNTNSALGSGHTATSHIQTNCVVGSIESHSNAETSLSQSVHNNRDQRNLSNNAFESSINVVKTAICHRTIHQTKNITSINGVNCTNATNGVAELDLDVLAKCTPLKNKAGYMAPNNDRDTDIDISSLFNDTEEKHHAKYVLDVRGDIEVENPQNEATRDSAIEVSVDQNVPLLSSVSSTPVNQVEVELDRIKQTWAAAGWNIEELCLDELLKLPLVTTYVHLEDMSVTCLLCSPDDISPLEHLDDPLHNAAIYEVFKKEQFRRALLDLEGRQVLWGTCKGFTLVLNGLQWQGFEALDWPFKCLLCNELLVGLDQPYRHMLEPSEHTNLVNAQSRKAIRKTCVPGEYHCAICNETFADASGKPRHVAPAHVPNLRRAARAQPTRVVAQRTEDQEVNFLMAELFNCCAML